MSHKHQVAVLQILAGELSISEAARRYDINRQHLHRLLTRYKDGGLEALEPASRRPKSNPNTTSAPVRERIVELRRTLTAAGHDAGPVTITWHLEQEAIRPPSTSTIRRVLHNAGLVTPEPRKRPKSSYVRERGLDQVEVGAQVDRERSVPLLVGDLLDRLVRHLKSRIRHEDVDPAELGDGGIHQIATGLGFSEISSEEDHAAARFENPALGIPRVVRSHRHHHRPHTQLLAQHHESPRPMAKGFLVTVAHDTTHLSHMTRLITRVELRRFELLTSSKGLGVSRD